MLKVVALAQGWGGRCWNEDFRILSGSFKLLNAPPPSSSRDSRFSTFSPFNSSNNWPPAPKRFQKKTKKQVVIPSLEDGYKIHLLCRRESMKDLLRNSLLKQEEGEESLSLLVTGPNHRASENSTVPPIYRLNKSLRSHPYDAFFSSRDKVLVSNISIPDAELDKKTLREEENFLHSGKKISSAYSTLTQKATQGASNGSSSSREETMEKCLLPLLARNEEAFPPPFMGENSELSHKKRAHEEGESSAESYYSTVSDDSSELLAGKSSFSEELKTGFIEALEKEINYIFRYIIQWVPYMKQVSNDDLLFPQRDILLKLKGFLWKMVEDNLLPRAMIPPILIAFMQINFPLSKEVYVHLFSLLDMEVVNSENAVLLMQAFLLLRRSYEAVDKVEIQQQWESKNKSMKEKKTASREHFFIEDEDFAIHTETGKNALQEELSAPFASPKHVDGKKHGKRRKNSNIYDHKVYDLLQRNEAFFNAILAACCTSSHKGIYLDESQLLEVLALMKHFNFFSLAFTNMIGERLKEQFSLFSEDQIGEISRVLCSIKRSSEQPFKLRTHYIDPGSIEPGNRKTFSRLYGLSSPHSRNASEDVEELLLNREASQRHDGPKEATEYLDYLEIPSSLEIVNIPAANLIPAFTSQKSGNLRVVASLPEETPRTRFKYALNLNTHSFFSTQKSAVASPPLMNTKAYQESSRISSSKNLSSASSTSLSFSSENLSSSSSSFEDFYAPKHLSLAANNKPVLKGSNSLLEDPEVTAFAHFKAYRDEISASVKASSSTLIPALSSQLPYVLHEYTYYNLIDLAEFYHQFKVEDGEMIMRFGAEAWKHVFKMRYGYPAKALKVLAFLETADDRTFRSLIRNVPRILGFKWPAELIAETLVACAIVGHQGNRVYEKLSQYLQQNRIQELKDPDLVCDLVMSLAHVKRVDQPLFTQIVDSVRRNPSFMHMEHLLSISRDFADLKYHSAALLNMVTTDPRRIAQLGGCSASSLAYLPFILTSYDTPQKKDILRIVCEVLLSKKRKNGYQSSRSHLNSDITEKVKASSHYGRSEATVSSSSLNLRFASSSDSASSSSDSAASNSAASLSSLRSPSPPASTEDFSLANQYEAFENFQSAPFASPNRLEFHQLGGNDDRSASMRVEGVVEAKKSAGVRTAPMKASSSMSEEDEFRKNEDFKDEEGIGTESPTTHPQASLLMKLRRTRVNACHMASANSSTQESVSLPEGREEGPPSSRRRSYMSDTLLRAKCLAISRRSEAAGDSPRSERLVAAPNDSTDKSTSGYMQRVSSTSHTATSATISADSAASFTIATSSSASSFSAFPTSPSLSSSPPFTPSSPPPTPSSSSFPSANPEESSNDAFSTIKKATTSTTTGSTLKRPLYSSNSAKATSSAAHAPPFQPVKSDGNLLPHPPKAIFHTLTMDEAVFFLRGLDELKMRSLKILDSFSVFLLENMRHLEPSHLPSIFHAFGNVDYQNDKLKVILDDTCKKMASRLSDVEVPCCLWGTFTWGLGPFNSEGFIALLDRFLGSHLRLEGQYLHLMQVLAASLRMDALKKSSKRFPEAAYKFCTTIETSYPWKPMILADKATLFLEEASSYFHKNKIPHAVNHFFPPYTIDIAISSSSFSSNQYSIHNRSKSSMFHASNDVWSSSSSQNMLQGKLQKWVFGEDEFYAEDMTLKDSRIRSLQEAGSLAAKNSVSLPFPAKKVKRRKASSSPDDSSSTDSSSNLSARSCDGSHRGGGVIARNRGEFDSLENPLKTKMKKKMEKNADSRIGGRIHVGSTDSAIGEISEEIFDESLMLGERHEESVNSSVRKNGKRDDSTLLGNSSVFRNGVEEAGEDVGEGEEDEEGEKDEWEEEAGEQEKLEEEEGDKEEGEQDKLEEEEEEGTSSSKSMAIMQDTVGTDFAISLVYRTGASVDALVSKNVRVYNRDGQPLVFDSRTGIACYREIAYHSHFNQINNGHLIAPFIGSEGGFPRMHGTAIFLLDKIDNIYFTELESSNDVFSSEEKAQSGESLAFRGANSQVSQKLKLAAYERVREELLEKLGWRVGYLPFNLWGEY